MLLSRAYGEDNRHRILLFSVRGIYGGEGGGAGKGEGERGATDPLEQTKGRLNDKLYAMTSGEGQQK